VLEASKKTKPIMRHNRKLCPAPPAIPDPAESRSQRVTAAIVLAGLVSFLRWLGRAAQPPASGRRRELPLAREHYLEPDARWRAPAERDTMLNGDYLLSAFARLGVVVGYFEYAGCQEKQASRG
jgi:hypothetical protein